MIKRNCVDPIETYKVVAFAREKASVIDS